VQVDLALDVCAELGEGPVWDDRRERLLFVDIMRGHVHEFDPATGRDRVIEVGQPVGALALAERGDWIVAAKDGFHRLDPDSGRVSLLASVEADSKETRMNDGAVDPAGRFWAGTMGMDSVSERGTLYRLDPDGSVHAMLAPVSISNGIDWSPDARLMYYVDTMTGRIDVFDFDLAAGAISNRRPFVSVPESEGWPDGLVVDAEGGVWLALWEGGGVRRYTPDGRLDRRIDLPVSLVTKPAFGGPALQDLYITSAWIELDPAGRAEEPAAGGLFRTRPGVGGTPARRFAG
jgi:sugar lactone lactonase YvrE